MKTTDKLRVANLHYEDVRKMLQIMKWRQHDNQSDIIRETVSVATQYFKSIMERGIVEQKCYRAFSYRSNEETDTNIEWLLDNKHFANNQTMIRTCVRITFQLFEQLYGKVDELPPLPIVPIKNKKVKNEKTKKEDDNDQQAI